MKVHVRRFTSTTELSEYKDQKQFVFKDIDINKLRALTANTNNEKILNHKIRLNKFLFFI